MLEAPRETRLEGLPWQVSVGGMDVLDRDGRSVWHGNCWIGPDVYEERMAEARQRAETVCRAVNLHTELCNCLAEMVAMTAAMYRLMADLGTDILVQSDWAQMIARAASVMERAKQGRAG